MVKILSTTPSFVPNMTCSQGFVKGWAPEKLTGYEDGFACLVWSENFFRPVKTSCPPAEKVDETSDISVSYIAELLN